MFRPVESDVSFPKLEERILELWDAQKTFEQSLETRRGGDEFVFYDGPPFATGLPHYGHLIAGILKDIVPRYWTMRGHYVHRRFGWDCHGLPVENDFLPGPDDGLVPVESTRLQGMTDFIVVKTRHSMLRYNQEVADQILSFLKTGKFAHHSSQ